MYQSTQKGRCEKGAGKRVSTGVAYIHHMPLSTQDVIIAIRMDVVGNRLPYWLLFMRGYQYHSTSLAGLPFTEADMSCNTTAGL